MIDGIMGNRAYLKIFGSESLRWDNLAAEDSGNSPYTKGADLLGKAREQLLGDGATGSREAFFRQTGEISDGLFQVRYNPETIRFLARSGRQAESGDDMAQEQQIGMIPAANAASVEVELIFDSDSPLDTSVRDEMNLLLTLMQKSWTKEAGFYWGKMKVEGRITSFQGEYVMFHPNGMPAAGRIRITIQAKSRQSAIIKKIDTMAQEKPDKLVE